MERYYPFEHRKEREKEEQSETVRHEKEEKETFRGRRDGNSAASVVIHSGRVTERARQIRDRKERESLYAGEKKDPSFGKGRRDGSGKTDRNFRYGRSGGVDGGKKERFDAENDLRGKRCRLKVEENTEFGSFLSIGSGKKILLPFAEQTVRPSVGDEVEVSIYEDKGGRLTATMREPLVRVGTTGVLTVAAITKIGAFADNGMPKQVLIPFREMLHTPEAGDQILVYIYLDKSGREAGTMRVYRHLQKGSGYSKDDRVEGFVYEVNPELGVFVAVDDRYYGMIPVSEVFEELKYGDRIEARVSRIREDGKMDLLLREKLYSAADKDAEKILKALEEENGFLPFADKADTGLIRSRFSMSKNQFKRALGYLYKKRLIDINRDEDTVQLKAKSK